MSTKRKRHVSGHRVVDRALTPEGLKVRLQERDQRLASDHRSEAGAGALQREINRQADEGRGLTRSGHSKTPRALVTWSTTPWRPAPPPGQ